MRVYISGPISGKPNGNRPAFDAAARMVRALGLEAVNPHELADETDTWRDAMKKDVAALVFCDKILALPGHEASKGARIELGLARDLKIPIIKLESVELLELLQAAKP